MISDDETARTHRAENAAGQTPAAGSAGDGFWRIEQVSARTGLTKRTLRYYEEIGLLAPPTRTEGGYRLYSEDDIQHLQRIKRLKDLLGFSLDKIREIAQAEEEREQVRAAWASESDPHTRLAWMDHMADLTRQQLRLIEEKLVGLQDMRATLQTRLEAQERRREELQQQLAEEAR
jgi:MerR family transcriptional regulator, repressor of the yfmOP operon